MFAVCSKTVDRRRQVISCTALPTCSRPTASCSGSTTMPADKLAGVARAEAPESGHFVEGEIGEIGEHVVSVAPARPKWLSRIEDLLRARQTLGARLGGRFSTLSGRSLSARRTPVHVQSGRSLRSATMAGHAHGRCRGKLVAQCRWEKRFC